jgi:NADH-quinone oxidoreductase subunit L
MREMGGLAKHLPVTTAAFTIGSLALAGVPPLSGFFSKDEILALLLHEHHYVTFVFVVLASAVTAFYVTRMWFRVFTGPEQSEKLHEGEPAMVVPLVVLAAITVVFGFGTLLFARFLGHEGEWPVLFMWLLSVGIAGSGALAGWWVYGRRSVVVNTRVWKQRFGYFYDALNAKLYFDLTYSFFFVRGYFVATSALAVFDGRAIDGVVNGAARTWTAVTASAWRFDGAIIDGAVNGVATLARKGGNALRGLQTGRLQSYQRLVVGAVVLLLLGLYVVMTVKGV